MNPKNSIHAIRDALASQQQQGDTSLVVTIKPELIEDAMNALPGYRKLFAPYIPGVTDTGPSYAAYEKMQAHLSKDTILLFVECQTMIEFRQALERMPIRHSSEWRSFEDGDWDSVL